MKRYGTVWPDNAEEGREFVYESSELEDLLEHELEKRGVLLGKPDNGDIRQLSRKATDSIFPEEDSILINNVKNYYLRNSNDLSSSGRLRIDILYVRSSPGPLGVFTSIHKQYPENPLPQPKAVEEKIYLSRGPSLTLTDGPEGMVTANFTLGFYKWLGGEEKKHVKHIFNSAPRVPGSRRMGIIPREASRTYTSRAQAGMDFLNAFYLRHSQYPRK